MCVAGRKGSHEPAAEFNDGLSLLNMVASEKILDAEPSKLNFAVFGTLSLSFDGSEPVICEDFRLGQGHYVFTNNWWLASSKSNLDTTAYTSHTNARITHIHTYAAEPSHRVHGYAWFVVSCGCDMCDVWCVSVVGWW